MKNVIDNINKVMLEKGYTQEMLAQKVDLSRPYISLMLSGKRGLSIENIKKFSEALEVSFQMLMNGQESKEKYAIKMRGDFSSRNAQSSIRKAIIEMENYALNKEHEIIEK